MHHADIVVIGGGPVGLAFALAAFRQGRRAVVLEANTGPPSDTRTLALAEGSRLILNEIGVWTSALKATPIKTIHVSQRGGFGHSILQAAESGVPALGYTLGYRALVAALLEQAEVCGLPVIDSARVKTLATTASYGAVTYIVAGALHTLTAKLLVVADGGRSLTQLPSIHIKHKDYDQIALLARVSADPPHNNVAYERFTPTGPVALLPVGDEFGLVWSVSQNEADRIAALNDPEFLAEFQTQFGDYAGKFSGVHSRFQFPLRLRYADKTTVERTVLIGNAAQALHPVAGQGFNLGLRDADQLARLLRDVPADGDCGDASLLRYYRRERLPDTRLGIFFTDALVRGFSNDNPLLRIGRGVGLAALQFSPLARRRIAQAMMFGRSQP
ncbi:MAG: FAD-dependent monooxygenase [Burkholderiales bacterium]